MVESDGYASGAGTHVAHAQGGASATTGKEAQRQEHCNGGAEAAAKANVPAQIVITLR